MTTKLEQHIPGLTRLPVGKVESGIYRVAEKYESPGGWRFRIERRPLGEPGFFVEQKGPRSGRFSICWVGKRRGGCFEDIDAARTHVKTAAELRDRGIHG